MTASVDVFPDATLVTRAWLLTQSDLAALVGTRIWTKSPKTPVFPYLTLQRIGGVPPVPARIDGVHLQVAAWGAESEDEAASLVARTARAALHRMRNYRHATAVVTGVADTLGLSWQPDTVRTPPTPRFIFGVVVYAHIP